MTSDFQPRLHWRLPVAAALDFSSCDGAGTLCFLKPRRQGFSTDGTAYCCHSWGSECQARRGCVLRHGAAAGSATPPQSRHVNTTPHLSGPAGMLAGRTWSSHAAFASPVGNGGSRGLKGTWIKSAAVRARAVRNGVSDVYAVGSRRTFMAQLSTIANALGACQLIVHPIATKKVSRWPPRRRKAATIQPRGTCLRTRWRPRATATPVTRRSPGSEGLHSDMPQGHWGP